MECLVGLNDDIGFDCTKSIAGLENDVLLLNWLDVDRNQTQWNESKTRITNLVLKAGKRGYLAKGRKKFINGFSRIKKNGFEHGVSIRIAEISDNSLEQINRAVKSGLYIAIVEVLDKGKNGNNAFEILGYDYGLRAVEGQRVYNEADATYSLQFSTPQQHTEPRALYKWLEGNYSNTKYRFDIKLAESSENDEFKIFNNNFNNIFG